MNYLIITIAILTLFLTVFAIWYIKIIKNK